MCSRSPPVPSASIAGRTLQESTYAQREVPRRLPTDTPNIVIVLIDDAGPGLPTTFGGEVTTATLDRICGEGVTYNRFHTTAMCSPTRASLLTGRNHHEIGNGQIAELANDWDGYAGKIPRSSATVAEVLKQYGYATSAFGKWHNTPPPRRPPPPDPSRIGPPDWDSSTSTVSSPARPPSTSRTWCATPRSSPPPKTPEEGYHLSEDLADDAIGWLRRHKAFNANKPFFMYWASGCLHGPHHIMKEWADKYAGKFDDGWDAYRERVFERAKAKGWIPQDCELTARDETLTAWEDIPPEDEKPFQRRLMEVAAGYAEHVDVQVGRIADELEHLATATTRCSCTSGAITDHPAKVRTAPSQSCWRRTVFPPRCASISIPWRSWAVWTCWLATGGQPVSRRLGLGGQYSVQGHEAAGVTSGRHPQSVGGALAGEDHR